MADPAEKSCAYDDELAALYLRNRDTPCPGCGYNRRDGHTRACPECGIEFVFQVNHPTRPTLSLRFARLVLLFFILYASMELISHAVAFAQMIYFGSTPKAWVLRYIIGAIIWVYILLKSIRSRRLVAQMPQVAYKNVLILAITMLIEQLLITLINFGYMILFILTY